MKTKYAIKIGFFTLLVLIIGLVHSNKANAQLKWAFEFNLGYNLLIPYSQISFDADSYSFSSLYLNFPFGVKVTATTTPILLIDLGVTYEPRSFIRKMSFGGHNENLTVLSHIIKVPMNLRFNLPHDLFISTGFSLNFIVGYKMSGVIVRYDEDTILDEPDPAKMNETDLDDPYYVGDDELFKETFNRSDYTLNIGLGWKYNINSRLYALVWVNFEASLIDIDKCQYYKTYTFSIVFSGSIGINL